MLRTLILFALVFAVFYWRPLWRAWLKYSSAARSQISSKRNSATLNNSGQMSIEQARDILGVDANANQDAIILAHKRLIQKLHPDRGGSDYLAAQVNLAKQVLLNQRNAG
jgi:hypothetical protein